EGRALDFDTTPSHAITVGVDDGEETASAQITINLTDTNDIAPVFSMESYSFEAFEDIAGDVVIGAVEGSDPEGAPVAYKIITDDSELFAVDESSGEIILAEGKQLDFEAFGGAEPLYNIVVEVSDGELVAEVNVGITVLNIPEADPNDPAAFVTTWQAGNGETIGIGMPEAEGAGYNITINWGDGTMEELSSNVGANLEHQYNTEGTYTVSIIGTLPWILMTSDGGSVENLLSIEQWGSIQWASFEDTFRDCSNMVYNATDIPDLSQVNDLSGMFSYCDSFNGDLSGWNLENVESMYRMFFEATSFTGLGLETWDTQNVTTMQNMFANASSFNGDLGNWKTENVTSMFGMFRLATNFEGIGLETWNIQKVTYINQMFWGAEKFNADISGWDTGNVTYMSQMFEDAEAFDQNLGSWDISSVTNMELMLDNSGMSSDNYASTLIGWATLDQGETQIPTNMNLGADFLQYCEDAQEAWDALDNDYDWTINDGGSVNCPPQP
ncbi:MAG: BspA family leucine-rich repeat surface protein, partial [Allomuricauda sp.]